MMENRTNDPTSRTTGFVPMGKPPVVTPLWPPAAPTEPTAIVIEDPSVPLVPKPEGLSDAEVANALGAADLANSAADRPGALPAAPIPVATPTAAAPTDTAPTVQEEDPDRTPAVMAALRAGLLVDLIPTPDPYLPPDESSATPSAPVATEVAVTPAAMMQATTARMPALHGAATLDTPSDDPQTAIVLGRVIGSDAIAAAARAGKTRLRVMPDAYVTRSARRAMAVAGVAVIPDDALGAARSPDQFRGVLNPLEAGGAITRQGAGMMHTNGIPIGGDHLPGTLTVPPDSR